MSSVDQFTLNSYKYILCPCVFHKANLICYKELGSIYLEKNVIKSSQTFF